MGALDTDDVHRTIAEQAGVSADAGPKPPSTYRGLVAIPALNQLQGFGPLA